MMKTLGLRWYKLLFGTFAFQVLELLKTSSPDSLGDLAVQMLLEHC